MKTIALQLRYMPVHMSVHESAYASVPMPVRIAIYTHVYLSAHTRTYTCSYTCGLAPTDPLVRFHMPQSCGHSRHDNNCVYAVAKHSMLRSCKTLYVTQSQNTLCYAVANHFMLRSRKTHYGDDYALNDSYVAAIMRSHNRVHLMTT